MLYGTARSKRRSSNRKVAVSPAEQERRRAWGRERVRIAREKYGGLTRFEAMCLHSPCHAPRRDGQPCRLFRVPGFDTCYHHASPEDQAAMRQRTHERNVKCGRAAAAPVTKVQAAFDAADRAARQAGENATPPAAVSAATSATDTAAQAAEEALLAELGLEPPGGEE